MFSISRKFVGGECPQHKQRDQLDESNHCSDQEEGAAFTARTLDAVNQIQYRYRPEPIRRMCVESATDKAP